MKNLIFALGLLCCTPATWAFDLDACIDALRDPPYEMEESAAEAACEAKNANSGSSAIDQNRANVEISTGEVQFRNNIKRYFSEGRMHTSTCVGWCDPEMYPPCRAGYRMLRNSASDLINGAYHGRYWIRSAMCVKN